MSISDSRLSVSLARKISGELEKQEAVPDNSEMSYLGQPLKFYHLDVL